MTFTTSKIKKLCLQLAPPLQGQLAVSCGERRIEVAQILAFVIALDTR
jgi:hypothetical protein